MLDYTLNDDDDYWQRFGKRRKTSSLKGLPGVSAKRKKAVIRSACLTLSPDGRSWATATPEGKKIFLLYRERALIKPPHLYHIELCRFVGLFA